MRRLWVAITICSSLTAVAAALAADLPPAPAYKAPPVPRSYSWTGCYAGIAGGGAWGTSNHTAESGPFTGQTITGDFNISGGLVGGTIGCNYQAGNWVFGVEDDLSWVDKKGSGHDLAPFNLNAVSTTREKWLDTARGRLGFTWDRTLIYATGGLAVDGASVNICGLAGCVSDSRTVTGWTAGAGLEYAFWNDWSFKVEYLYADFGSPRFINTPVRLGAGTILTRDVHLNDNIVRAGLNYRFNWLGGF